ncbi:MAG: hypothetical protein JRN52_14150 [Nitrososphaerota archaeon]|nr:hypothetical protein [Nitrososphaerota archaeon]
MRKVSTTQKGQKSIKIHAEDFDPYSAYKVALGVPTKSAAFHRLIQLVRPEEDNPIGNFQNIFADLAPAVIYGVPGSGKSTTQDIFLIECAHRGIPFLLINSQSEHQWVSNVLKPYELATFEWLANPAQYRVELQKELNFRRSEVRDMARLLLRLENDDRLKQWVIAIEEGADYAKIEAFLTFLRRMRKWTRKIIVISTEAKLFEMCRPYRPMPFDKKKERRSGDVTSRPAALPVTLSQSTNPTEVSS